MVFGLCGRWTFGAGTATVAATCPRNRNVPASHDFKMIDSFRERGIVSRVEKRSCGVERVRVGYISREMGEMVGATYSTGTQKKAACQMTLEAVWLGTSGACKQVDVTERAGDWRWVVVVTVGCRPAGSNGAGAK